MMLYGVTFVTVQNRFRNSIRQRERRALDLDVLELDATGGLRRQVWPLERLLL